MSIAPAASKVVTVKEGNMEVFARVLEDAKVNLITHTYVTSIEEEKNGKFQLTMKKAPTGCGPRGDNGTHESDDDAYLPARSYDAVIIATPQYFDSTPQFNHSFGAITQPRYHHVYTSFVCGNAKNIDDEVTSILFTGDAETTINSIGRSSTRCGNGMYRWKFFSTQQLSREDISRYLGNVSEVQKFEWHAYPSFSKVDAKFPKLQWAPGVVYVPALEAATSAMEVSIVSGRNAAYLINDLLATEDSLAVVV